MCYNFGFNRVVEIVFLVFEAMIMSYIYFIIIHKLIIYTIILYKAFAGDIHMHFC